MAEGLIALLIQICVIALVIYIVLWVLSIVGINLPPKVVQIIWVIVALYVILLLLRFVPGLHLRL